MVYWQLFQQFVFKLLFSFLQYLLVVLYVLLKDVQLTSVMLSLFSG